jgi:hypothetical protein
MYFNDNNPVAVCKAMPGYVAGVAETVSHLLHDAEGDAAVTTAFRVVVFVPETGEAR